MGEEDKVQIEVNIHPQANIQEKTGIHWIGQQGLIFKENLLIIKRYLQRVGKFLDIKLGGRSAYQDKNTNNIYYTKDSRHGDIEVWRISGKKAYHQGSMEPVEGTMYRKPNHPPQTFE